MTYDAIETSAYEAEPQELFTFTRSAQILRYTSGDSDLNVAGNVYSAVTIQRTKVEQNQDPGRSPVTIRAARTLTFVQQYISSPPSGVVSLTIQRFHKTDTDEQVVVIWIGRVVNVKFESDQVTIRCEPILTALKRPALRRVYQTTCPHLLYGPICRATRGDFQLDATLTSASGVTLQSGSFALEADGYYTGGYIEWINEGATNRRFILDHVGITITINLPFSGIPSNADVVVFPGCDHSLSTCVNKFSNEENYGGFPYIPQKNPFNGTSIF